MTLAHTTLIIFLLSGEKNPYLPCVDKLEVGGKEFKFFNLTKLGDERYGRYCSNLMSLARIIEVDILKVWQVCGLHTVPNSLIFGPQYL